MSNTSRPSNKAKIALRVVEVLEYFDHQRREATVTDIVRRYNRPQSSTSELLSSLVDLGLLVKGTNSRSYSLAPRAALIGTAVQNDIVRDGRLVSLIDRLAAQTGLSVGVFGRVALTVQIVAWRSGSHAAANAVSGLYGGLQQPLLENALGQLLLSNIPQPRREFIIRQLAAKACDTNSVASAEVNTIVASCCDRQHARGKLGFGSSAEVIAALLPSQEAEHPLAIGIVYGGEERVSSESLLHILNTAIAQMIDQAAPRRLRSRI